MTIYIDTGSKNIKYMGGSGKKRNGEKGRERENGARSETQSSTLICSVLSFKLDGSYKVFILLLYNYCIQNYFTIVKRKTFFPSILTCFKKLLFTLTI